MGNVGAFGQLDDDRIVDPFVLVILGQFQAQPSSLQADHRVGAWIERVRPAQT